MPQREVHSCVKLEIPKAFKNIALLSFSSHCTFFIFLSSIFLCVDRRKNHVRGLEGGETVKFTSRVSRLAFLPRVSATLVAFLPFIPSFGAAFFVMPNFFSWRLDTASIQADHFSWLLSFFGKSGFAAAIRTQLEP